MVGVESENLICPEEAGKYYRERVVEYFCCRFYPFGDAVTERELDFFEHGRTGGSMLEGLSPANYFVDPLYERRAVGWILDDVTRPEPTLISGGRGTGKTMLRLTMEQVASSPQNGNNLVAPYRPATWNTRDSSRNQVPLDSHLGAIAHELAVSLFVRALQRFDISQPSDELIDRLGGLLARIDVGTRRQIEDLLREIADPEREKPKAVFGYAESFPQRFGRERVRPLHRPEELMEWASKLGKKLNEKAGLPDAAVAPELAEVIKIAGLWGFEKAYIAVDIADDPLVSQEDAWRLVQTLVLETEKLATEGVYLKLFLPPSMESLVTEHGPRHMPTIRLKWTKDRLRALVRERFRTVNSHRSNLEELAVPEFDDIDEQLINAADGNPRRLLRLIDELFKAYVQRMDKTSLDLFGAERMRRKDLRKAIRVVDREWIVVNRNLLHTPPLPAMR